MKKKVRLSSIIMISALLSFNSGISLAQCPGCITNMSCVVFPAAPAICPTTLPDGTALQPYDQDISFYLPANFDDPGSGYNLDLDQLDVLNIVGMPFGMSWETSASPSNTFYPTSNPPSSEHGCAKMCGTPLIAGQYTITVFVLAHVTVNSLGGITTTSSTSFDIPLTILPGLSSNSGFTIDNPMGCAPHTTGFSANYSSGGDPDYHYSWDFGNGNQSSLEIPPDQTYTNPGSYIVNLLTTIDTLGYFLNAVTVNTATGCDDVPWSAPDYYFRLKENGVQIFSVPYVDDTDPPVSFSFSPVVLQNLPYSIEIWEYDDGFLGADDHCGDIYFNGHVAGTYSLQTGNTVVTYTIDHPVLQFNDTDTIIVFASPTVSPLTFSPNDSICAGDSVKLWVSTTNSEFYQWYQDTSAIYNATDSVYWAKASGNYRVEVTNSNGCRVNSSIKYIAVVPNPPKPTLWIIGSLLNTNLTGYALQWYFEGNPVPGANNMVFNFTQTGNYFLVATNYFGCTTNSDTVFATYTGAGITENDQVRNFVVYPNPASGGFTCAFDALEPGTYKLILVDILGQQAYSLDLGSVAGMFTRRIELPSVASGIYNVVLVSPEGDLHQKIILQ